MSDEDIDLSESPEITEDDMRSAVLRVGGKPVPKGKSYIGMLLDSDVLDHFRKQAGKKDLHRVINEALRASMAKA